MPPKIEFYCVDAPKVYFSPPEALVAGYKTLPFFEIGPEKVLPIVENAFGVEIPELRYAHLSICDVLPTCIESYGNISQLKAISTQLFIGEVDSGGHSTAIFEGNGFFIAISGSDETWVVHKRPNCADIFEQFSALLDDSKSNAELLGKSAIFAPYFSGAA